MDRRADAINMLRRAVATSRNNAEAIEALAQGLIKEARFEEAEQQLREGMRKLDRPIALDCTSFWLASYASSAPRPATRFWCRNHSSRALRQSGSGRMIRTATSSKEWRTTG
ncbi:MAG: tetratricopeptide repeat protein [Nitrospira sp.]